MNKIDWSNIPNEIKGCQHFLKLADDHDERNNIVAYYARMAALQLAMKIFPGPKPPEVSIFLLKIMDWLEAAKKHFVDVEGITNETVAQALIEEYMLKLYDYAYKCDCDRNFQKNMVKAYYTASLLCEVLNQFGELSEDIGERNKIAKHRAAYIHTMLKQRLEPTPVNVTVIENEEDESLYSLTEEQVNKRRELRGEGPISRTFSEDEIESNRKLIDLNKSQEEKEAELERMRMMAEKAKNIDCVEPKTPEQIVDSEPPLVDVRPVQDNPGEFVLLPEQTEKAMKYCKWASSALNYDDVKSAVVNLERALYLCQHGKEKE